jgi:cytochrome c biogenesis protein
MGMTATVALLRGDGEIARHRVRTNSPLMHDGLAVIPLTVVPEVAGLRVFTSGIGFFDLIPGAQFSLPTGAVLSVRTFHPWGTRLPDGSVIRQGDDPVRPAVELELAAPGETPWRGWYFTDEGTPAPLRKAGIHLQPTDTVPSYSGVFAVNRDPGAPVALAGGILMSVGVLLALYSFYAKRARGDRPEIL